MGMSAGNLSLLFGGSAALSPKAELLTENFVPRLPGAGESTHTKLNHFAVGSIWT